MVEENDHTVRIVAGQKYWTTARAAEYLGVCKHTLLDKYCKTGLAHVKMCNTVLFKKEWLQQYVAEKMKINNDTKGRKKK